MSNWDEAWAAMARSDDEVADLVAEHVNEQERAAQAEIDRWYEERPADYGGAFDGFTVTSDADPGL